MHIQDLKRWHWVVIAIPIGLALSYAWTSIELSVPRHIGQLTFERDLVAPPIEGHPWLDNLVVHPPREGVMVVTGEQLVLRPNEKVADYKPFAFNAITPYQPVASPPRGAARAAGAADPNETVLGFLEKAAAKHEHVRFRYAWERYPAVVYTLWTGGAVVLIGGLWPTLVSLLSGAGFGGVEEANDYDLDRFDSGQRPAAANAGYGPDGLAAVEAELEQNLEGSGGAGSPDASAQAPADPRKLDGGPVEAMPLPEDDPNREYKGEFYPVAKPQGKRKG